MTTMAEAEVERDLAKQAFRIAMESDDDEAVRVAKDRWTVANHLIHQLTESEL